MNAPMRRGACPALAAPMATGDGLLVRLNPTAAGLSPDMLAGLCKAASRHGNGIVEVTARGSFQIRGLTAESVADLAADVDTLGIAVRSGVPVETAPLAGLDPQEIADPRPLAEAIRARISAAGLAARLGPKVSVVVDGGGAPWMEQVAADMRLTAIAAVAGDLPTWRVAVAGDAASATVLGVVPEAEAAEAVLALLGAIAGRGSDARARDLQADELHALLVSSARLQWQRHAETFEGQRATLPPTGLPAISPTRREITPAENTRSTSTAPPAAARQDLIGLHPLADARTALAVALPFGQIESLRLAAFLSEAEELGASEIRLAPKRALLLLCASADDANAVQGAARGAGLIVESSDPRLSVSACPGAPACASGRIATRELAEKFAETHEGLLDGSVDLHVSGCAKGCAHPSPAALTIVGMPDRAGVSEAGIVANAIAAAPPLAHIPARRLPDALGGLARLVRRERRRGETAADCLARLGDARLAAASGQGHP